jgi:hypothetical protein
MRTLVQWNETSEEIKWRITVYLDVAWIKILCILQLLKNYLKINLFLQIKVICFFDKQ